MARAQVSNSTYDVFLNFRGEDTRSGFTKNLHDALTEKGINAFMDDENLHKGEEISDVLVKAIEGSKIAIVVFSETYASSTWCLEELAMILECKDRKGQLVIPVFYKVEPTVVRKQKDSYAKHMADHERTFRHDIEKVLRWRKALCKAATISGWDSKSHRFEKGLINAIVEHVFDTLALNGFCESQVTAQGYVFENDGYKEKRVSDVYHNMATSNAEMVKIEELYGLNEGQWTGQVIGIHSLGHLDMMLDAAWNTSRLAILCFTATWCGPSVAIAPVFTSLAKEYPEVLFLKVDTNEAPDVAHFWSINVVPSFFFLKYGAVVDQFAGADEATLKWKTEQHVWT